MTRRGFFKKMMAVAAMFGLPVAAKAASRAQPVAMPVIVSEPTQGSLYFTRTCYLDEDGNLEMRIKGSAEQQPCNNIAGVLAMLPPCQDGFFRQHEEWSETLFNRPGRADYTFTVVDRQMFQAGGGPPKSNQDIARELAERYCTGAAIILPASRMGYTG